MRYINLYGLTLLYMVNDINNSRFSESKNICMDLINMRNVNGQWRDFDTYYIKITFVIKQTEINSINDLVPLNLNSLMEINYYRHFIINYLPHSQADIPNFVAKINTQYNFNFTNEDFVVINNI